MQKNLENEMGKGFRFPLGLKLTLVLLVAAFLMTCILFGFFGPLISKSFKSRSNSLLELSRDALDATGNNSITASTDLLRRQIQSATEKRRLHMMDLPLSLYENDAERIRMALEQADKEMSGKFQDNVGILADVMEQQFLQEMDIQLGNLEREQTAMSTVFAADIRRAYLWLAGSIFLALFIMLGFGLYRTVVHPLRQLRKGTRAVARGDLDVQVLFRSRDEVGGLSADFASMVRQLRESREAVRQKTLELEDLNRNLEAEVARQTEHLERALEDLQRTQRQLIHSEKMASIGTLAGGVAHEFNNLIGGIRGCTKEALDTEKDAERRDTLDVILRAANRASEITEQLLRFSRQRKMQMRAVDVTRILDEALLLVEPDARKRDVAVVRKIEEASPFLADGDALHQVFLNLCTNALQAMPDGGELTVAATGSERELVVRIQDTGVGIPDDHVDRIFEPFFTTKDQDADPSSRGSGLGLSVSYSIIEAHGGTLSVDSEEGQGTVFTVRLPITGEVER